MTAFEEATNYRSPDTELMTHCDFSSGLSTLEALYGQVVLSLTPASGHGLDA